MHALYRGHKQTTDFVCICLLSIELETIIQHTTDFMFLKGLNWNEGHTKDYNCVHAYYRFCHFLYPFTREALLLLSRLGRTGPV